MTVEISKLKALYQQLDRQQAAGDDVVADLKKAINNLELAYLKEQVLPQIAQFMATKVRDLRCGIDSSFQFDGAHSINYSFCTSGSMLYVKDSLDVNLISDSSEIIFPQSKVITNSVAENRSGLSEDQWIKMLLSMRCNQVKGLTSPQNAIFILTIIKLIQDGLIRDKRIFATTRLSETFMRIWKKYVPADLPFRVNAFYPYVHLSSEPFYYFVNTEGGNGFDLNQNWTQSLVAKYIEYTYFDTQLFALLHNRSLTDRLSKELIDKFLVLPTQSPAKSKPTVHPISNSNAFAQYKRYLSTLTSSWGKPYSASSISVYATALKSDYMRSKLKRYANVDSLENVGDIAIIDKLLCEVNYDSELGLVNKTTYLALKMFRDYRRLNPLILQ